MFAGLFIKLGLLAGGGFFLFKAVSSAVKGAGAGAAAALPGRRANYQPAPQAGEEPRVAISDEQALSAVAPPEAQWLVAPIIAAAQRNNVSPFILLAIAKWESNFGKALTLNGRKGFTGPQTSAGTGDFAQRPWANYDPPPGGRGFGHGIFQIDWGSHRAFLESGDWTDIYRQADYAARLWRGNADSLARLGLTGDALTLATTASYNTGLGNVKKNLDLPDRTTTGGNYGTKVTQTAAAYAAAVQQLHA